MKNLKVGKKLLVGFGTMTLLLIGITSLSFFGLKHIDNQNQILVNDTMPNMDWVGDMRRSMVSLQRYLLIGIATDVKEEIFEATKMIEQDTQSINAVFEQYRISANADNTSIDVFSGQIENIRKTSNKIRELLNLNTSVARAQAFQTYQKEFKQMLNSTDKTLAQIAQQEQAVANEQVVEATNVYNAMKMILIGATALAALVTVFMVNRLLKYTIEPLKEIESAMGTISKGNFDISVDYTSKDEFGVLSQSMRNAV